MIPENIYKLRKELHQMPEPSLHEVRTKQKLMDFLRENTNLSVNDRGLWFYASWKEGEDLEPIAFRADFDAVEGADGSLGHFCGHDGHSGALAAFAMWISENKPERTIYLIFQPGEEIGAGAVLCAPLIKEKGIKEIYGFHNIPGFKRGSVLVPSGTFACGSTGMEITITGTPSHAAYPEAGKNPAEIFARLIIYMKERLSVPHEGVLLGTVIGLEMGSSAYGVSASSGVLRLTLRGEKGAEFDAFVRDMEQKAQELSGAEEMKCGIRQVERFPATENHPEGVQKVKQAAHAAGILVAKTKEPFRWSEDFGYYLRETDGAFFGIGAGEDHPQLHTAGYEFPDEILETAVKMYVGILS